jgi:hypothetical protein
VHSWIELDNAIPSSGPAAITLASDFICDYNSQIAIPAGTNITIHGNGVVLDAAQKGRFFTVHSSAALALDHLALQHGAVHGDKVSANLIDWSGGSSDVLSKELLTATH